MYVETSTGQSNWGLAPAFGTAKYIFKYSPIHGTMRFYHPPRDPDVTTFGDWLNRFGGQNKRKQSSRAVSNTQKHYTGIYNF